MTHIFSRNEWGAVPAKDTSFPETAALGIVLHNTESANRIPSAGQPELSAAFALSRNIQRHHMNSNGWKDIGHHFTVSRGGVVMEGRLGTLPAARRGMVVSGAHASKVSLYNTQWYGIELEGDNRVSDHVTQAQYEAAVKLCALLSRWAGKEALPIVPHMDVKKGSTDCPGKFAARIDQFKADVEAAFRQLPKEPVRAASATKRKATKQRRTAAAPVRKLDARPDTLDFRDKMYEPTLVEVPIMRTLGEYRTYKVPILDQGAEGACTGFGLSTVVNFLLRARRVEPEECTASARMLYEMARRYDEWPGENYDGSSARGAMKGWHKHGVCVEDFWPYMPGRRQQLPHPEHLNDAVKRPLGAYFRVNHKDIVAMHSALSEVGILYATAMVHNGWSNVQPDGSIIQSLKIQGGHAFAIVAYDDLGFWIQNSWGPTWGYEGFARITYDDWLANGTDVWVARLGAPIQINRQLSGTASQTLISRNLRSINHVFLRPHIVSIGNDGKLSAKGTFSNNAQEVRAIFETAIPTITKDWKKKRIVLFAHGGLNSEADAIDRVARWTQPLLDAEIYPISFNWMSDFWTTLKNILADSFAERRPDIPVGNVLDFMVERADATLEVVARAAGGHKIWEEMKENALRATTSGSGGARLVANELNQLLNSDPSIEVHLVGHSAGTILLAPLAQYLANTGTIKRGTMKGTKGLGRKIKTCTLWAPAATVDLFNSHYSDLVSSARVEHLSLYALTDEIELDDNVAGLYQKSLLYLVSNALEANSKPSFFGNKNGSGVPIIGMAKHISESADIITHATKKSVSLILSPSGMNGSGLSSSRTHGGFDDDAATLESTLARILGKTGKGATMPKKLVSAPTDYSVRTKRQTLLVSK